MFYEIEASKKVQLNDGLALKEDLIVGALMRQSIIREAHNCHRTQISLLMV